MYTIKTDLKEYPLKLALTFSRFTGMSSPKAKNFLDRVVGGETLELSDNMVSSEFTFVMHQHGFYINEDNPESPVPEITVSATPADNLRDEVIRRSMLSIKNKNETRASCGFTDFYELPEYSEMSDTELLEYYEEQMFRSAQPMA